MEGDLIAANIVCDLSHQTDRRSSTIPGTHLLSLSSAGYSEVHGRLSSTVGPGPVSFSPISSSVISVQSVAAAAADESAYVFYFTSDISMDDHTDRFWSTFLYWKFPCTDDCLHSI